jgi:DNA polymerase elongation subunit (family B)
MKILYIDIETSPNLGHVWSLWNQNISLNQLMESGEMLCFSAIWGHKPDKVIFKSEWDDSFEGMVAAAWDLLDEADVVVHYNGRRFDVPWIQRCFVELELSPPSPYRQVDLYSVVKSEFRFPSNKLLYVTQRLLGETKVAHEGHSLWVKVMNGDSKARKLFKKYCIQDTRLLISLHDRLLPWIKSYPSHASFETAFVCPKCGLGLGLVREGYAHTQMGKFQRYHCNECGAWSRDNKRIVGTTIAQVPNN